MSTRRGVYEAMIAEATPARQRVMLPWEKLTEAQKEAIAGGPDKGPDEKVEKKSQAKKAPKKKATRKKVTSKKEK